MSIQAFYTQPSQAAATTVTAGAKAATGEGQNAAMAFMDIMLANVLQKAQNIGTSQTKTQTPVENEVLQSQNPLLDKKPNINIASLIATDATVQKQVEEFIQPTTDATGDELGQTLVLNQQAFDKILKPLADEKLLPEEALQKLEALKSEKGEVALQDILNIVIPEIQELSAKGQISISNLTPEQITEIQTKIAAAADTATEISQETTDAAITSILQTLFASVKITAPGIESPASQGEEIFKAITQPQKDAIDPSALNNIDVGDAPADGEEATRFEELAESLKTNTKPETSTGDTATPKMAKPEVQAHVLPSLPSLAGLDPANWCTFYYADQQPDILALGTASVTSASTLANPVTQAQSVTQSVPGTQMVAMTMQKMGMDGQNRAITLQLDPPELGRVEVKMNFDKNKSIKAVLTVEKPETFHMLQRDAHALERAMQDIGLNAEGGMSFELAQDGHNFNQDGGHDGSRNAYKNGGNAEQDNIIESTMTWQVDNSSGHVRYNIWA